MTNTSRQILRAATRSQTPYLTPRSAAEIVGMLGIPKCGICASPSRGAEPKSTPATHALTDEHGRTRGFLCADHAAKNGRANRVWAKADPPQAPEYTAAPMDDPCDGCPIDESDDPDDWVACNQCPNAYPNRPRRS